jgi:hypothetical protein
MTIGLGHYLSVAAIVFTLGVLGIFLNRKNVIVILMSIELIQHQPGRVFEFPGRHRRSGLRLDRADGCSRGSGHRLGDPGRLLPQPRLDRGRRHQFDERLTHRMSGARMTEQERGRF